MTSIDFYCPVLSKNIAEPQCLKVTYAVEGRINSAEVPEVTDWEKAQDICADCVNAYWNKNNLEPPEFARRKQEEEA